MSDRQNQAVERLRRLTERSNNGHKGLSIPLMIEAVVGPGYDDEIEKLVTMALSSSQGGMSLKEIAEGILAIEDWRYSQA